jgi:hypothetical protein
MPAGGFSIGFTLRLPANPVKWIRMNPIDTKRGEPEMKTLGVGSETTWLDGDERTFVEEAARELSTPISPVSKSAVIKHCVRLTLGIKTQTQKPLIMIFTHGPKALLGVGGTNNHEA